MKKVEIVSLEGKTTVLPERKKKKRFQGKRVLLEIERKFHNDEMVNSSGSYNNYKCVCTY